jgi:hypothetical protein
MKINGTLSCILMLSLLAGNTKAQNGVSTPYSRYGFGKLSDATSGFSSAMGGIGYGIRENGKVNTLNPASYSAVDSLTFIFDAGVSLENVNYSYGKNKTNKKSSSFDYLTMQFRAWKNIGMTVGVQPFSRIGYESNTTSDIEGSKDDYNPNNYTSTASYKGSGGLHKAFVGAGYRILDNLSVGANFSYMFGDIQHTITYTPSLSSSYINYCLYSASISTYSIDLGAQYTLKMDAKKSLTIGAAATLGHTINNDASLYETLMDSSGDTIYSNRNPAVKDAFELPLTIGAGVTYRHDNRLTIGADYTLQKWGDCKFPMKEDAANGTAYASRTGYLLDRSRFAVGAEYIPNPVSRKYLRRVKYRLGASYSTPYIKVNGADGPREISVTGGFSLPIQNQINNRSCLNISAQWVNSKSSAIGLTENYLRVCVGLTFNERWFMKWKFD